MAIENKIFEAYKQLSGKRISYMGKYRNVVAVTKIKDGSQDVILIVCESEIHNVKVPETKADELINEFIEIGTVAQENNEQAVTKYHQEERRQIKDLSDIMMENIKKVQQDKEYIPQAKVVTNSVNTLLNMAKLKIQMNNKGQNN